MKISMGLRRVLGTFLCTSGVLVLVGCVFIYSSSCVFALEHHGNAHFFVVKQVIAACIGTTLMLVIAPIPLPFLHKIAPISFICSLGLISIPLIFSSFARTIHGSARWISVMGFSLQPIEFARVFFILMIAYIMSSPAFTQAAFPARIISILCVTGPLVICLLLQPDFGQAVLCTLTAVLMFTIVHQNLKNIFALLGIGLFSTIVLIIIKPYRLRRLLTFLHPWNDPQGAGFQIIQSLIAIGSGGITGIGLGKSRQKFFYLPMQHTDFIFSIIAEETGFLGTSLLILLYIILLYCGMYLAWHAQHTFAQLTVFGYTISISLQALINLAVTTGVAPTKGIGLPFVSYGMSSLIAHGCMLGIIVACTRHTPFMHH